MNTPSSHPGQPHFLTAGSWKAAQAHLEFVPRPPSRTAGRAVESVEIFVRDHRLREVPIRERSLEVHYGAFVVSQQRAADVTEARRRALDQSYGGHPQESTVAGRDARVYELGPEVPADDVDGRSPAVITWADGDIVHLIASGEIPADQLIDIAESIYD